MFVITGAVPLFLINSEQLGFRYLFAQFVLLRM